MDRIDLCRICVFNGEENFDRSELFSLMEIALIENKAEFVELLIEKNIDLNGFLTERQLLFLYNSNQVKTQSFFKLI